MPPRRLSSRALAVCLVLAASPSAAAAPRPIAEVRQAQIDAAGRAHAGALVAYKTGTGALEAVYQWSVRWLQAERAALKTAADRLAAAARHRARMDQLTADVATRTAAGLASPSDLDAANYYAAEAELWAREPG